jgi:hypothetical protein
LDDFVNSNKTSSNRDGGRFGSFDETTEEPQAEFNEDDLRSSVPTETFSVEGRPVTNADEKTGEELSPRNSDSS